VACFLVNFTKAGTRSHHDMPDQARALLRAGLWGIPATAQLRLRPRPGDRIIVAVGAPARMFVGDAVIAEGYRSFSRDELARFPIAGFGQGLVLSQTRVWNRPVPVKSVSPQTAAYETNPRALWFGAVTTLTDGDAQLLINAASVGADGVADPSVAVPTRARRHRTARQPMVGISGAVVPAPRLSAVEVLAVGESLAASKWALPARIAHADWGTSPPKQVAASAEQADGTYIAHASAPVSAFGDLPQRLGLRPGELPGGTLLGFDFAIGVPESFARLAGIDRFSDWLQQLEPSSPLFEIANEIEQVSLQRPFFPRNIAVRSPGIKQRFHDALGLSARDVLRRCDRGHAKRGPASEMLWTLGAKAVGKATLSGWRDVVRPALAEPHDRYAIWPFDGPLLDLLAGYDAVIVETYPAESYATLGLRIRPRRITQDKPGGPSPRGPKAADLVRRARSQTGSRAALAANRWVRPIRRRRGSVRRRRGPLRHDRYSPPLPRTADTRGAASARTGGLDVRPTAVPRSAGRLRRKTPPTRLRLAAPRRALGSITSPTTATSPRRSSARRLTQRTKRSSARSGVCARNARVLRREGIVCCTAR
jgi:hypothetical protein